MAKDLDDGYTRIANEVLEDLAQCKFFCVKSRVVLAIIRNTWGWKGHPKVRELSQTYLAEATGASVDGVKKALRELIESDIVLREGSMTGYNKHWPQGGDDSPLVTNVPSDDCHQDGGDDCTQKVVTIDTTKKEKKEKRKKRVDPPIPAEQIFMSVRMEQEALKNGIHQEDWAKTFENFQGYYGDEAHTPVKWTFLWRRWCERDKDRKEKNHGNETAFDRAAKRFLQSVE